MIRIKTIFYRIQYLAVASLQSALALGVVLALSSCSYLERSSNTNLAKQIERQQAEREMITEPSAQDNVEEMTVAEFEDMGDLYLLKGDINKAYFHYIKGLEKEPEKISLLHKQGELLLKKKRFSGAVTIYRKLLALDGKDPKTFEGLGRADFGLGNFEEAELNFLEALEINPERSLSHEYMGLINSRRQNYDRALFHFQRALANEPDDIGITNNLAITHYLNGNFKDAVALLKKLVKISSARKIYNNLALGYFQLGFYQEALESFKHGSEDEAAAYNNMGYQFLSNHQYEKAIQAFEKAIALHPRFYLSAQKNLEIARNELSNLSDVDEIN